MLDERRAQSIRDAMTPAWNELREQRVLGRVLASTRAQRRRRRAGLVASFAAAAAVVVAVLVVVRARSGRSAGALAAQGGAVDAGAARLALADGSEALLSGDARVQIDEQRTDRVRLTQTAGRVRYRVRHAPERPFAVRAGGVEVRVRGTEFTVALEGGAVDVRVTRGRVEVDDGTRMTVLVGGEQLRVLARGATPGEHDTAPASAAAAPGATTGDAPATEAGATTATTGSEPASAQDDPTAAQVHAAPSANGHAEPHANRGARQGVDELFAQSDAARRANDLGGAADALRTLIAMHPRDAQVVTAYFQLARVEASRGRAAAAAEAYARCWRAAPRGTLAEDAQAEEALAWQRAGDDARARAAATRYLRLRPTGAHAARMRTLAGE